MRVQLPASFGTFATAVATTVLLLAPVPAVAAGSDDACCSVRVQSDAALPVQTIGRDVIERQDLDMTSVLRDLKAVTTLQPGVAYDVPPGQVNVRYGQRMGLTLRGVGSAPSLLVGPIDGVQRFCGIVSQIPAEACERIEVVRAGAGAVYGVDASAGVINIITRGTPDPPRFTVGLGARYSSYVNLEDVACDPSALAGLTDCTTESGMGFGGSLELRLTDRLTLGAQYTRGSYEVNQQYGSESALHDVTVSTYGGYAKVRPFSAAGFFPFLSLGGAWFCNESDVVQNGQVIGSRGESGWRAHGGVGVDLPLTDALGLRPGIDWQSGGGGDADSRLTYGLSVTLSF